MTYQPIVPLGGYTGWLFLQRTLDQQQTAFKQSEPIARATDYFRENISEIRTAEGLVADRQLLTVALGAFGLDEDINNKFFIEKILSDGTTSDEALANRLADPRYAKFAEAFGFGDFPTPLTSQPIFSEDVIDRFEARQFERAIGNVNNDLRLALNLEVALDDVNTSVKGDDARWFGLLGNQPLRQVVQTALGLPSQIAAIDLDQQLSTFKERAQSVLGTDDVGDFVDPEVQEKIVRLFLIRSEAAGAANSFTNGSIALTLLRA